MLRNTEPVGFGLQTGGPRAVTPGLPYFHTHLEPFRDSVTQFLCFSLCAALEGRGVRSEISVGQRPSFLLSHKPPPSLGAAAGPHGLQNERGGTPGMGVCVGGPMSAARGAVRAALLVGPGCWLLQGAGSEGWLSELRTCGESEAGEGPCRRGVCEDLVRKGSTSVSNRQVVSQVGV